MRAAPALRRTEGRAGLGARGLQIPEGGGDASRAQCWRTHALVPALARQEDRRKESSTLAFVARPLSHPGPDRKGGLGVLRKIHRMQNPRVAGSGVPLPSMGMKRRFWGWNGRST